MGDPFESARNALRKPGGLAGGLGSCASITTRGLGLCQPTTGKSASIARVMNRIKYVQLETLPRGETDD